MVQSNQQNFSRKSKSLPIGLGKTWKPQPSKITTRNKVARPIGACKN